MAWTLALLLLVAAVGVALVLGRPTWRVRWITPRVMPLVAKLLPRLGDTERIALEAGTVWWDAELFSGRPDWAAMSRFEPGALSPAERAFLDGPVERLCEICDEWIASLEGGAAGPPCGALLEKIATTLPAEATLTSLRIAGRSIVLDGWVAPGAAQNALDEWRGRLAPADAPWTGAIKSGVDGSFSLTGTFRP